MRLFIAINFDDKVKDYLFSIIKILSANSKKGSFTLKENLHLTVIFIGETERANDIMQAMDRLSTKQFSLKFGDLGYFRRDGGNIYWIGVEKSSQLSEIYNNLFYELSASGFGIEKREYRPHLTLGRQVILSKDFNKDCISYNEMKVPVTNISLMKSERINGKLTYTEIYSKQLSI